jgi:DNA-binding transcriptional regulator YbjK
VVPTETSRATSDGRRARGEQTRRRLLDATLRVVARDGPGAVTHRAVAAEADVTKSLATYHFATIDDLFVAALIDCTETYAREVAADLPPDSTPRELAEHVVASFNAQRDEWLASYELFLYAARRPALRPAALKWTEWTTAVARRYTDDPVAVEAFACALDGLGLHALMSDDPIAADRLARILEHLLTRPG